MEAFVEERLAICKVCPLVKMDAEWGPICDSRKYISPEGDKVSIFPKEGYKRGCGCRIRFKSTNKNAHCIVGKW